MSQIAAGNAVLPFEPLLTLHDVAHIERVSKATIYRRFAAGFYPSAVAFKLGTRIRFRPDFYRAWLMGEVGQGQGATPPPREGPEAARPAAGA